MGYVLACVCVCVCVDVCILLLLEFSQIEFLSLAQTFFPALSMPRQFQELLSQASSPVAPIYFHSAWGAVSLP